MTTKRIILMLLVMLGSVTGAWALDNVSYVDANGQGQTANNVTVINAGNSNQVTWNAGWYMVQGDITFSKGVICRGNVNLILADGAKLTVTGSEKNAGIQVNRGSATLTIYGQTAQTGSLNATGTPNAGAGIGGGLWGGNGRIIINGGNITVRGGLGAAGIGGGNTDRPSVHPTGEDITINGGTVKAYGGSYAAGIGGGADCDGKNITINGGKVTAIGGSYAAGIGGGYHGTASNITINGGDVFAQGGDNAIAIGCGSYGDAAKYVYVADGMYVRADNQNPPHTLISHTGIAHDIASSLAEKAYVRISPDEHVFGVSYMDADRTSKTTDALLVTDATEQVTWNNDWYVVYGDVTLSKGAICQGDVKLILADGATLTASGAANEAGIRVSGVGNSLTIYVQSAQTGQLIATGGTNGAGIGGANGGDGSNITVLSGFITATGGTNASAIGGGAGGSASDIYVADRRAVKVGNSANPTSEITHTLTTDIAQQLAGNRYAKIMPGEYMYDVSYVDENGEVQTVSQAHFIAENVSEPSTWTEGWYAVFGDVTYSKYLTCTGKIHLILLDGAKFTVSANESDCPAIAVTGSNPSLTIYGQSGQSGQLKATANWNAAGIDAGSGPITINGGTITATAEGSAGISGGNITINRGKVTASGGIKGSNIIINGGDVNTIAVFYFGGISGTNGVTINSGMVTATGGYGSGGISGGRITIHNGTVTATGGYNCPGIGSNIGITINGGVVTATGGESGAGIGGGNSGAGSNITINGGVITAKGGGDGAGIGGGMEGNGSNITINGGEVNATGGSNGAGIGGGWYGNGSNITINGGFVTATGGVNGAGIGGGKNGSASNIFVDWGLSLKVGNTNPPTTMIPHSNDTDVASNLNGQLYAVIKPILVPYIDEDGQLQQADHVIELTSSTEQVTWTAGWYVAKGEITLANGAACSGDVHLILADGATLTTTGDANKAGIRVSGTGNSLSIYGQEDQTGKLIAQGGNSSAGIGGGNGETGSNITLHGGVITATGGLCASAIGGGEGGSASNIFVNTSLTLKADNTNPPTTAIAHTSNEDVTGKLTGKRYATVMPHVHEYASEWQHDEHSHWHACISEIGTCTAPRGEEVAHCTPDILNDQANYHCDVCGYTNEAVKAQYDARDYMSMTAVGGEVTVGMAKTGNPDNYTIQVSADGNHWSEPQTLTETATLATIPEGETYYFRHDATTKADRISSNDNNYWSFTMEGTGTIEAGGNIMSLLDATCQQTELPGSPQHVFTKLFFNCEKLTVAPRMDAITSVPQWGFVSMFSGSGITEAPVLSATQIRDGAYRAMFENCKELVSVPMLPATWLNRCAYWDMFKGCDKLASIEIANIQNMVVEEGSTGRENSFHDMLAETAVETNGVIIAPVAMLKDTRISLPSNWQWATKLKLNEDPTIGKEGNFYTTFYDSRYDYTVAEGHKAYSGSIVNGDEEDELLLTPTPDNIIPKGNGVILHGGSGEVLLTVSNDIASPINGNVLTGSNTDTTAPANCYIMSYGQYGLGFYRYADGKALSAHKAYLTYEHGAGAQARAFRMVFADDNEVDGIQQIENGELEIENSAIYNLKGMRLNKLQKGINIVNGKKVIVK